MKIQLKDGDFYEIEDKAVLVFDAANGWHIYSGIIDLAIAHGMTSPQDLDSENAVEYLDEAEEYLNDQIITADWSFGWQDGDFMRLPRAWESLYRYSRRSATRQ